MKFSVVVPARNAEETIDRTILSLVGQSLSPDDFEIILIDDGSTDKTYAKMKKHELISSMYNWKIIKHEEPQNKAISRNDGMREAEGEWICWLDADDFYLPFYLESIDQATQKYPEAKVFYFGGLITWSKWDMGVRKPREVNRDDVFRSGGIMSGGFVFKRECLDKVGYLPAQKSPYAFGFEMLSRFPEIKPLYKENQLDLGNPFGDDWAMFYLLTREYQPQILNITPYVVVTRGIHSL